MEDLQDKRHGVKNWKALSQAAILTDGSERRNFLRSARITKQNPGRLMEDLNRTEYRSDVPSRSAHSRPKATSSSVQDGNASTSSDEMNLRAGDSPISLQIRGAVPSSSAPSSQGSPSRSSCSSDDAWETYGEKAMVKINPTSQAVSKATSKPQIREISRRDPRQPVPKSKAKEGALT